MKAYAKTAALVEELVDYDGPQLLLLKTNRKHYMLAVAVKRPQMSEPFFGVEITDRVFEQYFAQEADLLFAFRRAIGQQYYFFDEASVGNDVGRKSLNRHTWLWSSIWTTWK